MPLLYVVADLFCRPYSNNFPSSGLLLYLSIPVSLPKSGVSCLFLDYSVNSLNGLALGLVKSSVPSDFVSLSGSLLIRLEGLLLLLYILGWLPRLICVYINKYYKLLK